ncbi:MAG: TonB-dependent receptor domain-containing protein [Qingshengfaniella sp.]
MTLLSSGARTGRVFSNKRHKARGSALALALAGGLPAAAQSQNVGDDSHYLGQIVVTAAGFEQLLRDAPASISVVTGEELANSSVTSLNDVLRTVQGVAITGNANESDIYMRGLPGAYTLILVDGRRQGTRDARTNGNAGFEQSFIPPVSAIDRIEVVRGPMSSLYGSDAMGGVVNIITKKVSPVWGGEISVESTFQERSEHGDSRQMSFYLNGPVVADRLGLQLWGRAMSRDNPSESLVGGLNGGEDRDLTGRLTWTPTDQHDIMFEMGTTQVDRDNPDNTPSSDNDRDHWSLSHVGRWSFAETEVSLSREIGERRTYRAIAGTADKRRPKITNTTLDAKANLQAGSDGAHNLTFGGQFFRAELEDQNPGLRDGKTHKFSADQWALFIEDEWQLTDDFALTFGLRYNDHEEYDGHFTPRLYGVWNATDALTVKGGVSTGFRAPDIRSITPGYAYTTGGGRCSTNSPPSCGVIIADPDLKAETSTSYELGVMYETRNLQLGATAFHTRFKDKIENFRTSEKWTAGPQYPGAGPNAGNMYDYDIFYNRNISKATIQGLELTADWRATDTLSVRANYTYTDSEKETGEYKGFPLARTPEHMANLRLDWDMPVDGLRSWASANYHGREINSGLRIGGAGKPKTINGKTGREYDSYTTADLGMTYQMTDNLDMNMAVYNVFDKQISADDENNVIEGRRLWIGVNTRF